jgi:glycosyltransferase involved in cell wall biosynthesis/GT2 family glycosyltransferase
MDSPVPTGASSSEVKLAFASCSRDRIDPFIEEVRKMGGLDLPVYVVAEFKPTANCHWIPWHPFEDLETNRQRILWHLGARKIRFNCILLEPKQPYWDMRWLGFKMAPVKVYFFNENYGHFALHPRDVKGIVRHIAWRSKNLIRKEIHPGGKLYTILWRFRHPLGWERPILYRAARRRKALATAPLHSDPVPTLEPGITVVIPSREGRQLLDTLLPGITPGIVKKIIIVDNGSSDNTGELASEFIQIIRIEQPLPFAVAVNLGIRASRTTHTCLLNNDMMLQPGFFEALNQAFDKIPALFCATAQIEFPAGKRREETGKANYKPTGPRDFPLRCDLPIEGENYSPVFYGSGGCSLYDTAKLLTIGCFKESFRPAYVEDLDTGWRGWQQGWPTVFVADAKLVHYHRSTTARFIAASSIELAIEQNYLRWILSSVATPNVFNDLWKRAVNRANLLAAVPEPAPIAMYALRYAAFDKPYDEWDRPAQPKFPEQEILALGSGDLACFSGQASGDKPRILIATCYLPFPLSHGGAVRMYNLMREAAKDYSLILLSFVDDFQTPAPELAALCAEIIEVKREGSHYRHSSPDPKAVSDFKSPTFEAAIRWVQRKWQPAIAQLEFTQMAQYAQGCKPAKTILVEHDITLDLYAQLLKDKDDFDLRIELEKWNAFERNGWREVDSVVVMSHKDSETVEAAKRVDVIENGVDLERFNPSEALPEPGRLLFIGSLAHLPNLMALAWFVEHVWPKLRNTTLHIIAGRNPDYYIDFYKDRVVVNLKQEGIELEAFVSDVRPAYSRAEVVIAPLLASAGTNIKIMEAMACGKAIVATPGGVNGLSVDPGNDFLLGTTPEEFASAIETLQTDPALRRQLEQQARKTAEDRYSWTSIGQKQKELYSFLANAE